jgi:hypothetical protein
MKRYQIILAVLLLIVPPAARSLWFYQGVYQRSQPVATPDYASYQVPVAPVTDGEESSTAKDHPVAQNSDEKNVTVLVDAGHGNRFSLSEIQPLTDAISHAGGKVVVANSPDAFLLDYRAADAYLVIAPAVAFSGEEIAAVEKMVGQGGRMVVMADPTRNGGTSQYSAEVGPMNAVSVANQLLDPFGLVFSDDYLYNLSQNESNFRNIVLTDFSKSPLTDGLKEVVFYSALSLSAAPTTLIQGDDNTLSSLTDQGGGLAAVGSDSNGRVVAIGDMTFATEPYNQIAGNARLVQNLANYLVEGSRQRTLTDYPYVFQQPVQFLVPGDIEVDPAKTAALGLIHASLGSEMGALKMVSTPEAGVDLVIPATYAEAQGQALSGLMKEFGLEYTGAESDASSGSDYPAMSSAEVQQLIETLKTASAEGTLDEMLQSLPSQSGGGTATETGTQAGGGTTTESGFPAGGAWLGTITVPGFGSIQANGNGLILLSHNEKRTTLALLASSTNALQELAALVRSGDLSNCAIMEQTAVCPLTPQTDPAGGG